MRVLELNTCSGIKSTGRIAADLARMLHAQGDECQIGYGEEPVPEDCRAFSFPVCGAAERKGYSQLRKVFDAEGYGGQIGTGRLIRRLKEDPPDIVHLHNLHGCYLNLGMLFGYLRQSDLPVIWTLHDCWSFTGHCAYYDYAECQKWQTQCERCPQQKAYPANLGPDGSRRNYQWKKELFTGLARLTLVTPCQWLLDQVRQSYWADTAAQVIYNGVDRNAFQPAPSDIREHYGIRAPHLLLAVAAQWDERKGLRYLLQAMQTLGDAYHLVVLGLSDAQRKGLPAHVTGLSSTSSLRELREWYSAADALCNPTMEDNMPLVNLEALTCGTPVVVFATGGCVECVDAQVGAVTPKADVAAFAEAIRAVSADKARLSPACLARAKAFDKDVCYQQYLSLYREVLL